MNKRIILTILFLSTLSPSLSLSEENPPTEMPGNIALPSENQTTYTIFDDKMLLEGYSKKFESMPKETILAMMKDDTLSSYQIAAAIHVFDRKFSQDTVSIEKRIVEKILLHRLRDESPFVQIEVLHALCRMDRYRYFEYTVPPLIQKLDHYNSTVNELAYESLKEIIGTENKRQREARTVFNTLRKILFLSRNRLADLKEPTPRLNQKLEFLRWSIKVLGNQELNRLPKVVLRLL